MDNNDFLRDKRKRVPQGEKKEGGERRPYDKDRREGDRKPFSGNNEHRSYGGDRKPFSGNNERRSYGSDRREGGDRPYNSERKPYDGERRPYNSEHKPYDGERRPYNSDRKPYGDRHEGGERRSFNPNFTSDNKLREGGERSFGDRKPYGERKSYGDKPAYGDRKPYGERKSFGDKPAYGDRKPYGERKSFGDKPAYGERKSFGDKPAYGERKSYGDKPAYGERKSFGGKKYGDKKPFLKGVKPTFKGDKTRVHGEFSDGSYPSFAAPEPTGEVRLNRHIAASGHCSRRDADQLIRDGRVSVNGEVVTEMGHKVLPTDVVTLDGAATSSEKKVYILMNKPKGFVTTLEDPHADKTVIDLLGSVVKERVYPVGRLDKSSVGVLLLTNDGDLTSRLTHPSHNKKKIYQATLDQALTHAHMQQIADGVELEDGPIAADAIDYAGESKKEVGIEIHSGRNRVVRRIFEHLGYRVTKLDRVYFAGLTKRNLKRGQWRFLTAAEVTQLLNGMYE